MQILHIFEFGPAMEKKSLSRKTLLGRALYSETIKA